MINNHSLHNTKLLHDSVWYAERLEREQIKEQQTDFTTAALQIIRPGTIHRLSVAEDPLLTALAPNIAGQRIATPFSVIVHLISEYLQRYEAQQGLIAWIGEEVHPLPHILNNTSNNLLTRSIFINPQSEKERSWIFQKALHSRGVVVAIGGFRALNFALARKFALTAKQTQALGFIISPQRCQQQRLSTTSDWLVASNPNSQPALVPTAQFSIQLQRAKGCLGTVRNWQVRCVYEHKLSFNTLSTLVDRAPAKQVSCFG